MLPRRRTLRCRGHSATGLAIVPAAGATTDHPQRHVTERHGDASWKRKLARREVVGELRRPAPIRPLHAPYYRAVSDETKVQTRHGELTPSEIADALPGTGEVMASVGTAWWKCAYAARGGNWELAAYFARRVRGLQRGLAVTRPKYAGDLAAFEEQKLDPVLRAIEARAVTDFERTFASATDRANELHVKWAKPYIRWVLPDEPPRDLHLGPIAALDR